MKGIHFIEEDNTILDAMRQLDKSARGILFVQDHGKLLAALTDGDLRRWILKKGELDASIKYAANYNPIYLYGEQRSRALHMMDRYSINAIPILDHSHLIIDIIYKQKAENEFGKFKKDLPVVIMAGGFGTRLSPYTNILPKPLIPVGDYPIAEHIINSFYSYGSKQFYMIVNYKRNMIKAYFDDLDKEYDVTFITEERILGTGGGLSLLKGKIKDTFILTNCDILIDDDLSKAYEQHISSGNIITMVCSLKNFTIPYGVVDIGEDGRVETIQEKPNMSFFTNTGCYFVEPQIIEDLEYNEPIDFPSIIERYMREGKKVGIYPINEDAWLDMGQVDELEKMKVRLGC